MKNVHHIFSFALLSKFLLCVPNIISNSIHQNLFGMTHKDSIMQECIGCHHINPSTYNNWCKGCGRILCLVCLLKESFECSVCGGYFIEPAPY